MLRDALQKAGVAGLARETQAPPGKPVSPVPFQGGGVSDLALSTVVLAIVLSFVEGDLGVPGFLLCWCAAQKIYDPVSLAKQNETNIGWFWS